MVEGIFLGFNKIAILFMSISVALQLFGIQYFLTKMKGSFGLIKVCPDREDQCRLPINQLKESFTKSKTFYLLILVVFSSLAAAKVNAFYSGIDPFFYQKNPVFWALLLDIYDNLVSFLMFYLLAILLWMIFNISFMLFKINSQLYNESLKIEPLDSDRAGGLKPLKELLLFFGIYYFLILALAVFSNLTPRGLHLFESISLGLFWLIGAVLFLYDWYALRRFLKGKIEDEVSSLGEVLESKRTQLIDLVAKSKEKESDDQIESLSNARDIIDKERDRIQQYKIKPIGAKTAILFVGFSALSLITILKASSEAAKSNVAIFVIGNTQPYINDLVNYAYNLFNYLYYFLPK